MCAGQLLLELPRLHTQPDEDSVLGPRLVHATEIAPCFPYHRRPSHRCRDTHTAFTGIAEASDVDAKKSGNLFHFLDGDIRMRCWCCQDILQHQHWQCCRRVVEQRQQLHLDLSADIYGRDLLLRSSLGPSPQVLPEERRQQLEKFQVSSEVGH